MTYLYFLILSAIQIFQTIQTISITQTFSYPEFCKQAISDEKFPTFRSNPLYGLVVENLNSNYNHGLYFLNIVQENYPHLSSFLTQICAEDTIGGPISHFYSSIGASCSPTTLRYAKIAGDLQREFGDLSDFHIIEIGGGYGGQCKILNNIGGFAKYTIIDLPECTPLINKYLSCFNIQNVQTINSTNVPTQSCDLLISNYAFSEIDRHEQASYIEKMISLAPRGYMLYNNLNHPSVHPLSLEEFVTILSNQQKKVTVLHENASNTGFIIIWHS